MSYLPLTRGTRYMSCPTPRVPVTAVCVIMTRGVFGRQTWEDVVLNCRFFGDSGRVDPFPGLPPTTTTDVCACDGGRYPVGE